MKTHFDGTIDQLRTLYAEKRDAIIQRLAEFARIPKEEYFYECAYCLLTPQSSAVNAARAIETLKRHDFQQRDLDPEQWLHQEQYYIRFHKTKAKNLIAFKEQYPRLMELIARGEPGDALREWIVQNIRGMGWKEASHFLRNVGYRDLAILDRHILRNLVRAGVLQELPKTLTPKTYKAIEEQFKAYASRVGIPMDELDLLFWSFETGEILK